MPKPPICPFTLQPSREIVMKGEPSHELPSFAHRRHVILRWIAILAIAMLLLLVAQCARSDEPAWEYKVVILQGVTAGGTIEKDANGVFVDTGKTKTLNTLAAAGWEVITVVGGLTTDHSVYLRRRLPR